MGSWSLSASAALCLYAEDASTWLKISITFPQPIPGWADRSRDISDWVSPGWTWLPCYGMGAGRQELGLCCWALPCPAMFHGSSQSGRLSGPRCFSLSHTHTLCYCLVLFSFSPSGQTFPPQQLVSQPPSLNPDTTDDVSVFITVTAMWLTSSFTCQYSRVSTDQQNCSWNILKLKIFSWAFRYFLFTSSQSWHKIIAWTHKKRRFVFDWILVYQSKAGQLMNKM